MIGSYWGESFHKIKNKHPTKNIAINPIKIQIANWSYHWGALKNFFLDNDNESGSIEDKF